MIGRTIPFLFPALLCVVAVVGAVEVPFHPDRGLVEVEVLIDGRVKGRFGIDTGADRLYIDQKFAEKNSLSKVGGPPPRLIVGVEGSSAASWVELRSLKLGSEQLYNLKASAIDLGALIKDQRLGYPDGLMGHEILRQFYVTVDYPRRKLEMKMEEPDVFATKKFVSIPFKIHRHLIVVEAVFNDKVTAPMILDYCASTTLVTPDLAKRLGISSLVGARARMESIQVDDSLSTTGVMVSVRDLKNLRQSAGQVQFEGILGGSFLNRHKITVDYKRKKIHLHTR
ncbi:MAG: pepsin/retropepsin-like aspartic protease family protein [candidate division Zixibacteria bacterium]|nr:pepsin/retropepsin-like aspartic protease family protein [candidate division Zixibacteria bacterium]MDH3936919.1 pepsin/retropepsin-like aspartic protease family protein [candidate division Zixibacteria bacterium]